MRQVHLLFKVKLLSVCICRFFLFGCTFTRYHLLKAESHLIFVSEFLIWLEQALDADHNGIQNTPQKFQKPYFRTERWKDGKIF